MSKHALDDFRARLIATGKTKGTVEAYLSMVGRFLKHVERSGGRVSPSRGAGQKGNCAPPALVSRRAAMWMSTHRGTRPLMFLKSLTEERLAAIRGTAQEAA